MTYGLRVRAGGHDSRVSLGNSAEGWDEVRADRARRELQANLELGLWKPQPQHSYTDATEELTFRELATEWFEDRQRNPEIRPATIKNDLWALTRYLLPFFGELFPSQITVQTIKAYRRRIHDENAAISAAADAGQPLLDPRARQPLRPLGNDSINKTLRTLAAVLDEAEDHGWIARNVARGRRMREPVQRRKGDILHPDEFLSLLGAAESLDSQRHSPRTLERAQEIRRLRDGKHLTWEQVVARTGIPIGTAFYLYRCHVEDGGGSGPRRAIIATLGLAGLRVGELCQLNEGQIDLEGRRIHVRDSKTGAGVRVVDVMPCLRHELDAYRAALPPFDHNAPAFPTRTGGRRDRQNVTGVVQSALKRDNELRARAQAGEAPILARVTPHTLGRSYISFMLAAGHDLPYVQSQVGHEDPTTTLRIYAQVINQPNRDQLRRKMRDLLASDVRPEPDELTRLF